MTEIFDFVVVGGGPSGATAANDLALAGHKVMLLDRMGRIKPCGGAVPPRLLKDFDVPIEQLCTRAYSQRPASVSHPPFYPKPETLVGTSRDFKAVSFDG